MKYIHFKVFENQFWYVIYWSRWSHLWKCHYICKYTANKIESLHLFDRLNEISEKRWDRSYLLSRMTLFASVFSPQRAMSLNLLTLHYKWPPAASKQKYKLWWKGFLTCWQHLIINLLRLLRDCIDLTFEMKKILPRKSWIMKFYN